MILVLMIITVAAVIGTIIGVFIVGLYNRLAAQMSNMTL